MQFEKKALNTYEDHFYYPYEDEFGYDVVFQTSFSGGNSNSKDIDISYWTGISNNFDIKIECRNKEHASKVNNLKEYLKIESLYNHHKDYVRDIIRNAVIYNDSRIYELLEQFPQLFQSRNEVINSVYMNCIDKESWGKRPLSKLTYDIIEEFKIPVNND